MKISIRAFRFASVWTLIASVWTLIGCCCWAQAALAQGGFDAQLQPIADAALKACVIGQAQKNHWDTSTQVTNLECNSQHIKQLEGLSQFTQLAKLSLYNNELERADVQGFSQLKHVNLAKNQLAQITLAALPALEELYLFGNKLTQLQLSQLAQLKTVKINDNQLTQFTYSDLPSLEKIYLFNNKIVDLDIYHLPAMRYMDARQNPMPDKLYEDMDKLNGVTILHDGNAKDWE